MGDLAAEVQKIVGAITAPGPMNVEVLEQGLADLQPLVRRTRGAKAFLDGPRGNAIQGGLRWAACALFRFAQAEYSAPTPKHAPASQFFPFFMNLSRMLADLLEAFPPDSPIAQKAVSRPWGSDDRFAPTSIVEPVADLVRMRAQGWGSELNTPNGEELTLHLLRLCTCIAAQRYWPLTLVLLRDFELYESALQVACRTHADIPQTGGQSAEVPYLASNIQACRLVLLLSEQDDTIDPEIRILTEALQAYLTQVEAMSAELWATKAALAQSRASLSVSKQPKTPRGAETPRGRNRTRHPVPSIPSSPTLESGNQSRNQSPDEAERLREKLEAKTKQLRRLEKQLRHYKGKAKGGDEGVVDGFLSARSHGGAESSVDGFHSAHSHGGGESSHGGRSSRSDRPGGTTERGEAPKVGGWGANFLSQRGATMSPRAGATIAEPSSRASSRTLRASFSLSPRPNSGSSRSRSPAPPETADVAAHRERTAALEGELAAARRRAEDAAEDAARERRKRKEEAVAYKERITALSAEITALEVDSSAAAKETTKRWEARVASLQADRDAAAAEAEDARQAAREASLDAKEAYRARERAEAALEANCVQMEAAEKAKNRAEYDVHKADKKRKAAEADAAAAKELLTKLHATIEDYRLKYERANKDRREMHDFIQELKGNIRVFCRIRPVMQTGGRDTGAAGGAGVALVYMGKTTSEVEIEHPRKQMVFEFDEVFDGASTQDKIYTAVQPTIRSALDGYNCCIFAYGQTGSGKTHTMVGGPNCRGVNYRALETVFNWPDKPPEVRVDIALSMVEIYNDNLYDLLQTRKLKDSKPLDVREERGEVFVKGLTITPVRDLADCEVVLEQGHDARSTAATMSNEHSSRSHAIVSVYITLVNSTYDGTGMDRVRSSKLHLIDLAGSERMSKTGVTDEARVKEGTAINKSLSSLADVISALQRRDRHIPYRNSTLTRLLQDSLGGSAKTIMFVNLSPNKDDVNESLSSATFASHARSVDLGVWLHGRVEGVDGRNICRENSRNNDMLRLLNKCEMEDKAKKRSEKHVERPPLPAIPARANNHSTHSTVLSPARSPARSPAQHP